MYLFWREVNYPRLSPQAQLAIFAMLGLVLVFLKYPIHRRFEENIAFQILDFVFAFAVVVCFGYILIQTELVFKRFWVDGQRLGDRAGMGTTVDYVIGLLGLLLVLEATRRAIGFDALCPLFGFFGVCGFRSIHARLAISAQGLFLGTHCQPNFSAQPRGVWHRLEGDVYLRVPLCSIWSIVGENGSHRLYYPIFARRLFRSRRWGAGQGCCCQQRSNGVAFWQCRRQYRHYRHLHHPDDAKFRF